MQDFAHMDRRVLMRNVALLLGAATVPTLAGCKAMMGSDGALDEAQLKLLGAISDTIIPATDTPGAVATGVPKQIAGMLKQWASPETQTKLTGAIDAIGKLDPNFAGLDAVKRKALLLKYDADAVKPGPPPKGKPHPLAMMMGPPVMNPDYVQLKGLIINLYYASEVASTKELVYEHVPGKYVSSMPVTPETRPFAGVGGLF